MNTNRYKKMLIFKLSLCFLVIISCLLMLFIFVNERMAPHFSIFSEAITPFSWSFCLLVISMEHSKAVPHNWVLKTFWIINFIISSLYLQNITNMWKAKQESWKDLIIILRIIAYFSVASAGTFYSTFKETERKMEKLSNEETSEIELEEIENKTSLNNKPENPEKTANIFSKLTFYFCNQILKLGSSKPLDTNDLWKLLEEDKPENTSQKFEHFWNQQIQSSSPSLFIALIKFLGVPYFLMGISYLIHDFLVLTGKFFFFFFFFIFLFLILKRPNFIEQIDLFHQ